MTEDNNELTVNFSGNPETQPVEVVEVKEDKLKQYEG